MKGLKNKTIVVGVCGGIAAYKTCELVRLLVEEGVDVHVIMTKEGQEFVTPLTFQALSGHPCHTDLFSLGKEQEINHITLADEADLVAVLPCTAHTLARLVNGLCDDLVTTVVLATQAPVLLAPSMNVNMWNHAATQNNLQKAQELGYQILDPEAGYLACGWDGKGRLPDPTKILQMIQEALTKKQPKLVST